MNFFEYIKKEKGLDFITEQALSKEEEKDIKEAGIQIAKEIFGKNFDKKKAENLINDTIKKNKNKNIDTIIEILTNSFQK